MQYHFTSPPTHHATARSPPHALRVPSPPPPPHTHLYTDACTFSPARVPEALTIAAAGRDDSRWRLSNKGPCVDLYAPGVDVTSAYFASKDGKLIATGTSMAAPHVAGVVALYLQQQPRAQAEQVGAPRDSDHVHTYMYIHICIYTHVHS